MGKNRLALYVFYDKEGIVDRHVIYKLKEMLKIAKRLIVICNGKLTVESRQALYEVTEDVITRKNEGYDAWAFKAGFDFLGWENLSQYDELILFNNSTYGPFFPFKIMFDEMERRNLDFWGISKHGEAKVPIEFSADEIMPEHISSYFFAFNSKMFLSYEFKHYWDNLPIINTHLDAVSLYEIRLTKYFSDIGFSWDVYIDTDKNLKKYDSIVLISLIPYELVKNYKMPMLKRKNFSMEYTSILNAVAGDSNKKAFEYIDKHTNYDVDMIWENMLRDMDIVNIKDNLHLNYILPKHYIQDKEANIDRLKIALFAHITHEDQIVFCAGSAKAIIENADIYVTTSSDYLKDIIYKAFTEINCTELKIIVLPKERNGRNASALWVALKPYMSNYEYICVINDKKTKKVYPPIAGRDYTYRWQENLLASKEFVTNVLRAFEENPRLGMLFPPPSIHGFYQNHHGKRWEGNYENTIKLAKDLGINVTIGNKELLFPDGSMFWFRTKSLKKLIDHDWHYDDFPVEPMPADGTVYHALARIYCYVAQSEGYYSAWLMTDSYAPAEITALNHLLFLRSTHQVDIEPILQKELKKQHDIFVNSTSWKVTRPLRVLKRLIKKQQ